MIESIFSFFAVGTLGFWLLVTLASIIFISCIENDTYVFPNIVLVVLGITYWKPLWLLGWKPIIIGFLCYTITGVIWSVYRWYRYVKLQVEDFNKRNNGSVDKDSMEYRHLINTCVNVRENKARIIGWICYWPWSLVWNLTGDFFTFIYDSMKGIYQKISDKALGEIKLK